MTGCPAWRLSPRSLDELVQTVSVDLSSYSTGLCTSLPLTLEAADLKPQNLRALTPKSRNGSFKHQKIRKTLP